MTRGTSRAPRLVASERAKKAVVSVLAELGTDSSDDAPRRIIALGKAGVHALLDAVANGGRFGPPDANGRAVWEDVERCLIDVARAFADVFVDHVERTAALHESFVVASALGTLGTPEANSCLARLLESRDGGVRWIALESLLERRDARAIAHLPKALSDRDGLVVLSAVGFARRWGRATDLPTLVRLAKARRTAPGTREAAWDAVESIVLRCDVPSPEGAPPPRLVVVPLPVGATVAVSRSDLVRAGSELARGARGASGAVIAPVDAVVVDIEEAPGAIILRRDDRFRPAGGS